MNYWILQINIFNYDIIMLNMENDQEASVLEESEQVGTTGQVPSKMTPKERLNLVVFAILGIVILGLIIVGLIFLLKQPAAETSHIRDIFIIFIALEFLIIGLALVILIVQLASLTNLLQNEIKPVLEATNETVNTLRGTATFLSDNVAEPVIKLNEYMAAIRRLIDLVIRPGGR